MVRPHVRQVTIPIAAVVEACGREFDPDTTDGLLVDGGIALARSSSGDLFAGFSRPTIPAAAVSGLDVELRALLADDPEVLAGGVDGLDTITDTGDSGVDCSHAFIEARG